MKTIPLFVGIPFFSFSAICAEKRCVEVRAIPVQEADGSDLLNFTFKVTCDGLGAIEETKLPWGTWRKYRS